MIPKSSKLTSIKGFTLIELIIVITILSILAIIAVPRFSGFTDRARRASDQQTVAIIANGIAVAIASEEIPSAEDKITLTGNSGELDKFNATITELAGSENDRKLQLATKADFHIHGNGSVTTTIYWMNGTSDSNVVTSADDAPAVTLYTLNVTYGTGGSVIGAGNYSVGTSVSVVATPDTGYKFKNWTGMVSNHTSSSTTLVMPSENVSIAANFEPSEVVFMLYAIGSNGTVSGSGTYNVGSTVNISATPDSGYKFMNWTSTAGTIENPNSSNTTISMPDKNITVTAKFELLAPTIIWTSVSSKNKIDVTNSQPGATLTLYKDGKPFKSQTGTSFGAPDKIEAGRYAVMQTVNGEVSPLSNELTKN
jgi:prepilin-type N-terminal cleavage/methylation domain-containing protein/uncharacterized repeat protein (TIGR02543 family)